MLPLKHVTEREYTFAPSCPLGVSWPLFTHLCVFRQPFNLPLTDVLWRGSHASDLAAPSAGSPIPALSTLSSHIPPSAAQPSLLHGKSCTTRAWPAQEHFPSWCFNAFSEWIIICWLSNMANIAITAIKMKRETRVRFKQDERRSNITPKWRWIINIL